MGNGPFPIIAGLLFILTFFSLISLLLRPGILHQGETLAPWGACLQG